MKDNRIEWLDTLKGFGIFLVFLGHSLSENGLKVYIYSFHMPMFFFISGLCFKKSQLSQGMRTFLLKKVKTRLIPYISFGLLTYFVWLSQMVLKKYGLYQGSYPAPDSLIRPLVGMVYGNGTNLWLIHNTNLWFLACLFVTEILIFYGMLMVNNNMGFIILLAILSIVGYLDSIYATIRLPFSFDVALTASVFYGAAIMSKDYILNNKIKIKYVMMCLIIGIVGSIINGRIDMNSNIYGQYFLFYLTSFLSILAYISIIQYIPKEATLSYIGKNTIPFFLMQTDAFLIMNIITYVIFHVNIREMTNVYAILYTIICMLILFPFAVIVKKYLPFMLGNIVMTPDTSVTQKVI